MVRADARVGLQAHAETFGSGLLAAGGLSGLLRLLAPERAMFVKFRPRTGPWVTNIGRDRRG